MSSDATISTSQSGRTSVPNGCGKGAGKGALIGGLVGAGGGTLYGIWDNKKHD